MKKFLLISISIFTVSGIAQADVDTEIDKLWGELCTMGACNAESIENLSDDQVLGVADKLVKISDLKNQIQDENKRSTTTSTVQNKNNTATSATQIANSSNSKSSGTTTTQSTKTISGMVVDEKGKPVKDLYVQAVYQQNNSSFSTVDPPIKTDKKGNFTLKPSSPALNTICVAEDGLLIINRVCVPITEASKITFSKAPTTKTTKQISGKTESTATTDACPQTILDQEHPHSTGITLQDGECQLTCEPNYIFSSGRFACIPDTGKSCESSDPNAKEAKITTLKISGETVAICSILSCNPGYNLDRNNNTCILQSKDAVTASNESKVTTGNNPVASATQIANSSNSKSSGTTTTQSTITVSGTVVDENKDPLPNVNVFATNQTKIGNPTDLDGKFVIDGFPTSEQKISISFMGYKTQQKQASECTLQNPCTIQLEQDNTQLEGVDIVASPICGTDEVNAKHHATQTELLKKQDGSTYCAPANKNSCLKFYKYGNGQCVSINGDDCFDTNKHETAGEWECQTDENGNNTACSCVNITCESGYKLEESLGNDETQPTKKCVKISGSCTPDDPNAKSGHLTYDAKNQKEICVIDSCKKYYKLSEDGTCVLSNAHSEEELKEKSDNVNKLRDNEQSLANRMTSAVSMGAAGIGGMMLAQSLSEQRVDKESEQDMAAYLATFRCEYAGGNPVPGGTIGAQLPADKLFDLYQEYVTLAADVQEAKSQLGLKPGIESEVVLDKANIALYDDTSTDTTNGTYASLYRALSDSSSIDAQKWNDQKAQTNKNLKIGIGVGAGGAALGEAGNILTNYIDWDNSEAPNMFKEGLKSIGMINVDKLKLNNIDWKNIDVSKIDFSKLTSLKDNDASKSINTTNQTSFENSLKTLGILQ